VESWGWRWSPISLNRAVVAMVAAVQVMLRARVRVDAARLQLAADADHYTYHELYAYVSRVKA
jgi:hypothetical protein